MIDSLGDRMKEYYEGVTRTSLVRRMPVIIRIDGKAFHTFTKGYQKPFDERITQAMGAASLALLKGVQNCKFVYTQSDEISLLLIDYNELETDAWFGNNIQKMVSVSSSIATASFNREILRGQADVNNWALFDARIFNIPREEVVNYFIWRQQDCRRNAVSVSAQSRFSPKQLHGKNTVEMKEMMLEKGFNWDMDLPVKYQNGSSIYKDENSGSVITAAPYFQENREVFDRYINPQQIELKKEKKSV